MKYLLIISALLVGLSSLAQSTDSKEVRSTADFSKLKSSGSFDIKLLIGSVNEVTIYGDKAVTSNILTEVEGGKLTIKPVKGFKKYPRLKIIIHCKSIEDINLFGSGDFTSGLIKSESLKFSARGSGDQSLNVECANLDLNISGSGDCTLTGKTSTMSLKCFGSGTIHGFDLNAETITIESKGSGEIDLNASGNITGEAFGSGDIECKGGAQVDINQQGSGTITTR